MGVVTLSLIVARARNGVIGNKGGLPWSLKDDMAFFKRTTMGCPVIMGRNTWESLPQRPLRGRDNIVLTHDWNYAAEGARVYSSLAPATQAARAIARRIGRMEVFIIGGAGVYARALDIADRLYITEVDAEPEGDTRMPPFDEFAFEETERTAFQADERNDHDFIIRRLDRRETC